MYAELIRIDRIVRHLPSELATYSLQLLKRHLSRRPQTNPIQRFGERFLRDLPGLQAKGLPYYHAWAFASIRQAGAAFDLATAHLRWLSQFDHPEFLAPAEHFASIAQGNKALILKGARAVNSRRPFDAAPLFAEMAKSWDDGMGLLLQAC